MQIREITSRVTTREVDCFVVDYNRLLPNSWPRLTPVAEFELREADGRGRTIDYIRALELLYGGLSTTQVAERLGCCRASIFAIRAAARDQASEVR